MQPSGRKAPGSDHGALQFKAPRKVVFMIDGWFMWKRVQATKAFPYTGSEIRKYCKRHLRDSDSIFRLFYYDTEPLSKKGHNPISGKPFDFKTHPVYKRQSELLNSIRRTPNFALRLGETVWRDREWVLSYDKIKELINKKISVDDLKEEDVKPRIEQKAVDMKIGIDIALTATKRLADVLILVAGDSDIVPALKLARREGMLVGLDPLGAKTRAELEEHVDFLKSFIRV